MTLNYGGGYYSAASQTATSRAAKGGHKSLLNVGKAGAQTRAQQSGNVIYGTFTSLGGDKYDLEGFGTVTLGYTGEEVTSIEVTTEDGQTTQYTTEKEPEMSDDTMTNALCRTWKIERIHEIYVDKETGERFEGDFSPENPGEYGYDMPYEVMFSKAGTYVVSYLDNTFMLAVWKWQNRGDGVLTYGYDGEWQGETCTISFDGDKATVHEKWNDEYESSETWTYLVEK